MKSWLGLTIVIVGFVVFMIWLGWYMAEVKNPELQCRREVVTELVADGMELDGAKWLAKEACR